MLTLHRLVSMQTVAASDFGPLDGDFDPFDDDEAVESLVTFE
jgi:hypothetical protein